MHQFWGIGSRKSVKTSFSMYSIGIETESSFSSGAQTGGECDSDTDTLGAERARGSVCEWDDAAVSRAAPWPVAATVPLPSVTAAFTVTKKLHKSVRDAGRADISSGRPATRGNIGTSPNCNVRIHQFLKAVTHYKVFFRKSLSKVTCERNLQEQNMFLS